MKRVAYEILVVFQTHTVRGVGGKVRGENSAGRGGRLRSLRVQSG